MRLISWMEMIGRRVLSRPTDRRWLGWATDVRYSADGLYVRDLDTCHTDCEWNGQCEYAIGDCVKGDTQASALDMVIYEEYCAITGALPPKVMEPEPEQGAWANLILTLKVTVAGWLLKGVRR